ncbi:hypothetical protein P7C70_g1860, partial [Phenoliferia sp. Uapishka_3]
MEWHEASPRILNRVRYAALRVTHFSISTTHPGVPESLALHFPSLQVLQLKSTQRVDVRRLLENLEGRLKVLVDRSAGDGGVESGDLAMVLRRDELESVEGLKGVIMGKGRKSEELVMSCVGRGVRLEEREQGEEGGEDPFIPRRFGELWNVRFETKGSASQE